MERTDEIERLLPEGSRIPDRAPGDPGPRDPSAARTAKFLKAAADLAAVPRAEVADPAREAQLQAFLNLYRQWIIAERNMSDSPEGWTERTRIMLHCMVGASTIDEATEFVVRFAPTIWGSNSSSELRREGDGVVLAFNEPVTPGPTGLVCEMWPLIANLTYLEFVAGGDLHGVTGRVRNPASLPRSTTALLFGKPLLHDAPETCLVIPGDQLRRAAVARASDIPGFLAQFMRASLGGSRRTAEMRPVIANVIRDAKLRDDGAWADLPSVAERLGSSPATVRRRLREEGSTFREIKEEVFDELAKGWLANSGHTVEQIAGKLGYSDAYAFRRAFRRRNGVPPLAYRRQPG